MPIHIHFRGLRCGLILTFLFLASPCGGATIHVPADQPTIQAGLDAASAGDTVLIACGTYTESDIQMKSGVCLRGASGEATCATISGWGGCTFFCSDVDSSSSIEGLTIAEASGIRCVNSSPLFKNLIIRSCYLMTELEAGGGLLCEDSSPTLLNVLFSANEVFGMDSGYGGGMACYGGAPTLIDVTFQNNRVRAAFVASPRPAFGGGLFSQDSDLTMYSVKFLGNSAFSEGGGMCCRGGTLLLREVEFRDNIVTELAQGGAGLSVSNANLDMSECFIASNKIRHPTGRGGGLCAVGGSVILSHITVTNNGGQHIPAPDIQGGNIYIQGNSSLQNSVVAYALNGGGIHFAGDGEVEIACCDVYDNNGGDYTGELDDQTGINGNIDADPLLCDPRAVATVAGNSPCLPENNDCGVLLGSQGVGCPELGEIIHVPADRPSIHGALVAAQQGDRVLVTGGPYFEHDLSIRSGVSLTGQGLGAERITVDATEAGRCLNIIACDSTTLIEGFVFKSGRLVFDVAPADEAGGAGIYCLDSAPRLRNLEIRGCRVSCALYTHQNNYGFGGGVYCDNSTPLLENVILYGNRARVGAGMYCRNSTPHLRGISITSNSPHTWWDQVSFDTAGGGIYSSESNLLFEDVLFQGNSAGNDEVTGRGAGLCLNGGTADLTDTCFLGNSIWGFQTWGSEGAGMYSANADVSLQQVRFINNHIANNDGARGGGLSFRSGSLQASGLLICGNEISSYSSDEMFGAGLYCASASVHLSQTTFARNGEDPDEGLILGGHLFVDSGTLQLDNSILAFAGSGGGIHVEPLATVEMSCNDVFGNIGGNYGGNLDDQTGVNGNISADPWFCDPANGDFALSGWSPCLPDANDCGVLMGCFGQGCEYPTAAEDGPAPPAFLLLTNHPNPFNPTTAIVFNLPEAAATTLTVHDLSGRRVRVLVNGEYLEVGRHELLWNGRDERGGRQASGVYLCRLTADDNSAEHKMILLK